MSFPARHMDRNPFIIPSHAEIVAANRDRVSADLTGRGATLILGLAASLALGIACMAAWSQLTAYEAAFKCAAGV